MNHKENSIQFWNQVFKDDQPVQMNIADLKIENKLHEYLKRVGDSSHQVLDVGCGRGTCLMECMCFGEKIRIGVGFDASSHAIDFAKQTADLSGIKGLSFYADDESFLKKLESDSFDGMICSNFLDVIPKDLSSHIIDEMKRILKPQGLLLLKFNFLLNDELINKLKMELIAENTYQMNGVIRAYNLTTEAWIKRFDGFDVISIDGYQRAEHLPQDRLILLKKR